MVSQKKLEANRLNAQKSTGPVTARGKAVSSRNALKTGKYAKVHHPPSSLQTARTAGMHAAIAEVEALTDEFTMDFAPQTFEERVLVGQLAHNEWLMRTLHRIEASVWRCHIKVNGTREENSDEAILRRASKDLGRLHRLADSTERIFDDDLVRLVKIGQVGTPARVALRPARKESTRLFVVPPPANEPTEKLVA